VLEAALDLDIGERDGLPTVTISASNLGGRGALLSVFTSSGRLEFVSDSDWTCERVGRKGACATTIRDAGRVVVSIDPRPSLTRNGGRTFDASGLPIAVPDGETFTATVVVTLVSGDDVQERTVVVTYSPPPTTTTGPTTTDVPPTTEPTTTTSEDDQGEDDDG
jgi:hypothetical protein